jgi:predicted ATPase
LPDGTDVRAPSARQNLTMSGFVRGLTLAGLPDDDPWLGEIPAVQALLSVPLELDPRVTFLVGDNGSGKSTLVEAIAVAAKLNPEGGGYVASGGFSTRRSHSQLHKQLRLDLARSLPPNRFFLRAESVFNFATYAETNPLEDVYTRELHERSHGESFLDIAVARLGPAGFYLFDEPEAALSVRGQLALLVRIDDLVRADSQFIIATHSPILIGYPRATILRLDQDGITQIGFDDAEQVELTRSFLSDRQRFLRHLFEDEEGSAAAPSDVS